MTVSRRRHRWGHLVLLVLIATIAAGTVIGPVAGQVHGDLPPGEPSVGPVDGGHTNVSEPAYREPVPEPGDRYFEAEDPDGEWISYTNPRDRYRDPYLGGSSGKICITLVNERGEVVVGRSIPETVVTIETGPSLSWHSGADPMMVRFPLTQYYDRPLDADQFGTDPDLPQGDGLLDSHCIEFHGLSLHDNVTYEEPTLSGPHADDVEVVGYHQVAHRAWDTDRDPIADAVDYETVGGGWVYEPDGSHGQVTIVLQLRNAGPGEGTADRRETAGEGGTSGDADDGAEVTGHDDESGNETSSGSGDHPAIETLETTTWGLSGGSMDEPGGERSAPTEDGTETSPRDRHGVGSAWLQGWLGPAASPGVGFAVAALVGVGALGAGIVVLARRDT